MLAKNFSLTEKKLKQLNWFYLTNLFVQSNLLEQIFDYVWSGWRYTNMGWY